MEQSEYRAQQLDKLATLVQDIRIAMLTTADRHGALHSRPLATQEVTFEGHFWCFVGKDIPLIQELQEHPQVNISFADPEQGRYVSISGTAALVKDREKMAQHSSARLRTWFSQGLNEPSLALLQIQVDDAEYWDAPSSTMTTLSDVAGTTLTDRPSTPVEHSKLAVDERQTGP